MYLISQDKAKQLFPKDTEITHPVVLKKLHEILSARGKKVSKQQGSSVRNHEQHTSQAWEGGGGGGVL